MFEKWQNKINKKLRESDDEEITFKDYSEDSQSAQKETEETETSPSGVNVSASESNGDGSLKIKAVRAESFNDVSNIADYLIDGYTVFLNTENIDNETCVRMLDFLNGVTYTIDGYIKASAKNSYIITPRGVDVSEED